MCTFCVFFAPCELLVICVHRLRPGEIPSSGSLKQGEYSRICGHHRPSEQLRVCVPFVSVGAIQYANLGNRPLHLFGNVKYCLFLLFSSRMFLH